MAERNRTITISIDVMGGDRGPRIVIEGAWLAWRQQRNMRFLFHGRRAAIDPLIDEFAELKDNCEVRDCETVIAMDEKPSQALRKGRNNSSMWFAIQSVKDGEADIAISGGNTGALMAMSMFCLRPMEGIDRPAIAAIWPTLRADVIVLDVGATIGADSQQLVDFSILGAALARALFDQEAPTIGLLNVGTEEVKGVEEVKEAAKVLAEASGTGMTYHGFVEGDDIGRGTVDVVVTEGFTGNIALKTAEGTARQVATYMRTGFKANLLSRIGSLFAVRAIQAIRRKMDPRIINGGVFLGLNGVVIKSHGGTDEIGFKSALGLAYEMARNNLTDKIGEGMRRFGNGRDRQSGSSKVSQQEPEAKPA